jgi:hypothetical protein
MRRATHGIVLDEDGRLFREALVQVEVVSARQSAGQRELEQNERNVTELLFDLLDRFKVRRPVEGVAAHEEQLDEVARHVPASHVQPPCQMRQGIPVVHRHDVGDAIAGIDDDAGLEALGVQGEDGLNGDVDAAELVLLEHDLAHGLAVLGRVHGRLGEEDLAVLRSDLELRVERVIPLAGRLNGVRTGSTKGSRGASYRPNCARCHAPWAG